MCGSTGRRNPGSMAPSAPPQVRPPLRSTSPAKGNRVEPSCRPPAHPCLNHGAYHVPSGSCQHNSQSGGPKFASSHRPMRKRLPSTSLGFKAKGDHHAREVLRLDDKGRHCRGGWENKEAGTYDPTRSPRFADPPPRYNTTRMNRNDGPEDSSLAERCLTGGLPEFGGPTGSFRRIVQTPGGISIFYDVGQGQGWQRNIVMDASPHLPANIRQWYGDSRGRFEGNTLVIDVTNFSPKTDFQGSRENLHLVERSEER